MTDAQYLAWLEDSASIKILLAEAAVNESGAEVTKYLANVAYNTSATDTPASTCYEPYLKSNTVFSEALNYASGQPSISRGAVLVDNSAGVRDDWLDSNHVWANRSIQLYLGDPRWVRADFRLIFDGVMADLVGQESSPDELQLLLLDKLARLNVPISEALLGGTTNNKDALIPQTFGEAFNVTPLLIDPALLKYQYHVGASQGVIEVRDNGAPVSYTDTPGSGYFVLNQSPVGTITCSVQGDKPAGVYTNNISNITQNILLNYGSTYTRLLTTDLDTTQLSAFATAHVQPVGLFSSGRTNVLAACQQLADSVGAQIITSSVGKVRIIQITPSPGGTPTLITDKDFDYHTISVVDRPPVVATFKLGYCQNWTVQDTGLAGGLPPADARLFQDQWLTTTQSDATTTALYKLDVAPVQVDTALLVDTDAIAEAQRRRDIWKVPRMLVKVRCRAHLLLTELGDPVTLKHYRYGLSAGKTGMVVSIERDWMNARITLGVLI